MSDAEILERYAPLLIAFAALQAVVLFLEPTSLAAQWAVIFGYLAATALAVGGRVWLPALVCGAVAIVRIALVLEPGGWTFRISSGVFAFLLFTLVVFAVAKR